MNRLALTIIPAVAVITLGSCGHTHPTPTAAPTAVTAPVTADPAPDYLARLNTAGIDYDAPTMIDAAKLVCDDLNQGATVASTVAQVVVRLPSYGTAASFQAGAIIGAAAATYCPQYHELVQAYGNGA